MLKRALGTLLALGFGLLASSLLIEAALRIHNPVPLPVRAYQIVLPVNNNFRSYNSANPKIDPIVTETYNDLGFRGPGKSPTFEKDLTLVTVGGSTTACVGLSDGHTWPDLLFERLSQRHEHFWLNNAGFNGQSTFGHLMLMQQYLAALKPDYVLYLLGANEVGRGDLNKFDLELLPDRASLRNRIVATSELLSTLQVLSRTFRAIELDVNSSPGMDFTRLRRIVTPSSDARRLLARHASEYVPGFRQRLRKLLALTREAGIRPILVTQPALYGEGMDPTLNVELGELEFAEGVDARLRWRVLQLYNEVTREEALRGDIPLIDLARVMPKDSRYYFDWLHYSREGAAKVAELVANDLERILPWE